MTFGIVSLVCFAAGFVAIVAAVFFAARRLGQGDAVNLYLTVAADREKAENARNELKAMQQTDLASHRERITQEVRERETTRARAAVLHEREVARTQEASRISQMEDYEFRRTASRLQDLAQQGIREATQETGSTEFAEAYAALLAAGHYPVLRVTSAQDANGMFRVDLTLHAYDAAVDPPVMRELCIKYMQRNRTNVGSILAEIFPYRSRRRSRGTPDVPSDDPPQAVLKEENHRHVDLS